MSIPVLFITEIGVLVNFPQLRELRLSNNSISNIDVLSALVTLETVGLPDLQYLDVCMNLLNDDAFLVYIPQLEDQGTEVIN